MLFLTFLHIGPDNRRTKAEFEFSFANREFKVESSQKGRISKNWNEGQKLLKYIFAFDYLPEEASNKMPTKTGYYLDPGDGFWYDMTPGRQNSKAITGQLEKLIETLKQF